MTRYESTESVIYVEIMRAMRGIESVVAGSVHPEKVRDRELETTLR